MKKRRKIAIVFLSVIVLGIGIGTKIHMDKVDKEKYQVHRVEKAISRRIISEYEGVKKIEFKKVTRNPTTGYMELTMSVNDSKNFGYDNAFVDPNDGNFASSYEYLEKTPLKEANKRKTKVNRKKIDLNNYEIIFHSKIDNYGKSEWTIPTGGHDKDRTYKVVY